MAENKPRTTELPAPELPKNPYGNKYITDILVIGCGYAGLNAAVSAKEKGVSVLVADKGKPGYSGMSPWASSFRWFDPERGDEAEAFRKTVSIGGDYLANMDWYECWIRESKVIYERLTDWGILSQFPKAKDAGSFYDRQDFAGYREHYDQFDRRKKWIKVLRDNDISWLEHVMIEKLLTTNGAVKGAIGFHVPSGETIVIQAKAVVMATGAGCYKPTGYPVGDDTFDGEYMAFELGLPITGKEFEDFHNTSSAGPGNVFLDNAWPYLENIWLCGGDVNEGNYKDYAASKANAMTLGRVRNALNGMDGSGEIRISDPTDFIYSRKGSSKTYGIDPKENRTGRLCSPFVVSDTPGGAIGLCSHLTSGVFCGLEDRVGFSGIEGLYLAGDGTHAANPVGSAYPCGVGFTSCFCSIDGMHAGKAAAEYATDALPCDVDEQTINEAENEMTLAFDVKRGFDAMWARDVLHSIMAPYWVSIAKTEETLKAALTQARYMKENVIPRLMARNGHELRQCLEMKHKVNSAELKLIASLTRKESRGNHFRQDIPYRDDDYLRYILLKNDGKGGISVSSVPVPERWAGDRTLPYEQRYVYYFPAEDKAKGFTIPEKSNGWGGRKK